MTKPAPCLQRLAADLAIKQVMLTHMREHIRHLRDIRQTVRDADLDVDTRGLNKTIALGEKFISRIMENIDRCAEVFVVKEPLVFDEDVEWM